MNKEKLIRKGEKGITLIALIITIVVLLILAVVAIRAVENDGIIEYAKNARDEYTAKADEEQEDLNNLLGQIEGSLSEEEKITWTKTSTGDLAIGSTVKHIATEEEFYVIGFKDNNETAILLAKDTIDTTNFVQSEKKEFINFCEESVVGYWGAGTSPYDIEETQPISSTHTAAYAADRYGAQLGATGRLMLHSEVVALLALQESEIEDILYGKEGKSSSSYLNYWLGSAYDTDSVWAVGGSDGGVYSFGCCDCAMEVRPVVEISKSNIS